eukprot:2515099-Rhodomonas_salina.2
MRAWGVCGNCGVVGNTPVVSFASTTPALSDKVRAALPFAPSFLLSVRSVQASTQAAVRPSCPLTRQALKPSNVHSRALTVALDPRALAGP